MHTAETVLAVGLKKGTQTKRQVTTFQTDPADLAETVCASSCLCALRSKQSDSIFGCCDIMIGFKIQFGGRADFVHSQCLLWLREDVVLQVKGYLETLIETDFVFRS